MPITGGGGWPLSVRFTLQLWSTAEVCNFFFTRVLDTSLSVNGALCFLLNLISPANRFLFFLFKKFYKLYYKKLASK